MCVLLVLPQGGLAQRPPHSHPPDLGPHIGGFNVVIRMIKLGNPWSEAEPGITFEEWWERHFHKRRTWPTWKSNLTGQHTALVSASP